MAVVSLGGSAHDATGGFGRHLSSFDRGGRRTGPISDRSEPMSDLNTTPLIDVLLVLLIMFIITIPPQTHSIAVTLPGGGQVVKRDVDPVVNRLAIGADGSVRWNGTAIDLATLRGYLAQTRRLSPEPELQFQPDSAARYVLVDQTLAVIRRSGVTKLGFVGNERYRDF